MHYLKKAIRSIFIQIFAIALFFFLYHKIVVYIMREVGLNLGAVKYSKHVVPLYAIPQLDLSWWIFPALVVCIGFLYLCYKHLLPNKISQGRLIGIAIICFIAINISVAQIDGFREIETEDGPERILALLEPYTRTSLEYYDDVPRINELGLRAFLQDFSKPELFDTLSGHTRTHPPGKCGFLMACKQNLRIQPCISIISINFLYRANSDTVL